EHSHCLVDAGAAHPGRAPGTAFSRARLTPPRPGKTPFFAPGEGLPPLECRFGVLDHVIRIQALWRFAVTSVVLKNADASVNSWCGMCGDSVLGGPGPQLVCEGSEEPVCRACGQEHAPDLVALADLAHVAQRVGRVCRHVLVPPMEALLGLARAAEDY